VYRKIGLLVVASAAVLMLNSGLAKAQSWAIGGVENAQSLAQNPSWICCAYACTTNGGQSHNTYFCHPSSIGSTCPALPAQSENAEQCVPGPQNQANSCEECVSGLPGGARSP
jgi:hypothetical protein